MGDNILSNIIDNSIFGSRIIEIQGHKVLILSGEIDVHTALQFKQTVANVLDTESHLIIDMHNVNYIDTSGLGILAYAVKRLSPINGTVNLVGCNPSIEDLFYITQMFAFVKMHGNMNDAIQAVFVPTSPRD